MVRDITQQDAASQPAQPSGTLAAYALEDRYRQTRGRVFLTGTQALVRIMLDQSRRDRAAGLTTAGFVSGYRGSPLGALDMEMWRGKMQLEEYRIEFLPAVNEDLGATAVLGAQQVALDPRAEVEGVFSMWYGKGPGVDRSGDALKHGNAYGSSPKGGVLVVAGDDHGCVSSSMSHQSDVAFMAWFMTVLNPASVAEYLPSANGASRCRAFPALGSASRRFPRRWRAASRSSCRRRAISGSPTTWHPKVGCMCGCRTCPAPRSRRGCSTSSPPCRPLPRPTRSTARYTASRMPASASSAPARAIST
ncbi:indolepyruvate ferredoxin oxidoreductase, alpha and beta subunits [Limimaricola cinnabarinus LL-001]|uniref:Indolepyruvate ferredoxin oxidoreductase, alpha and beta subunits n=1 Tax=Limimaricola cinnabarinus LL-001 TaxID=1337093 RepID=U2Z005_9RHOB|nr:indolepyruvate ferredoxin oxidoreductase, alpha and beta subunits [Limimaricola cinnabarinus LL-001]